MDSSPSPDTNGTMAQIWNTTESTSTNESGDAFNSTVPVSTSDPYHISYGELVFASIILLIILVIGIIGNSMIIWSVILSRKLQTSTNAFVVNLSVADLLTCLFLPWYIAAFLGQKGWPLPEAKWLCGLAGFTIFACIGTSLYTLAAIAVNQSIMTCSFRYNAIYKPWATGVMIALTWFIPGGALSIFLLAGIGGFGYERVSYPSCSDLDDIASGATFNVAQTIGGFPIPLVTIVVSYVWIYVYLRRHLNKDELKITKTLFVVVCSFIGCFLPFFIANAFPNTGHLVFYLVLPTFANSAINFVIYATLHPQFKIVLGCIYRCHYAAIPEPSRVLKVILGQNQHPITSRNQAVELNI